MPFTNIKKASLNRDSPFQMQKKRSLEIKLRPNLRQARTADGVGDSAEVGRILQINVRDGEVARVEDVENVQTDFKVHPLVDARAFDDAEVNAFL